MPRIRRSTAAPDYVLFILVVGLTMFGLVMLASASSDLAKAAFGNSYYYLTHQLLYGLVPGIVGFLLGYFLYYGWWEKWALPLLIVTIVLLVLVLTPLGKSAGGADRWVNLGGFTFQPSELLKITFFIYLSAWLSKNQVRSKSFRTGFLPLLVLLGIVSALLFAQPATSVTMIIFAASIIMYFAAGARIRFLFLLVLAVFLVLALLVTFTPYRFQRLTTFLHPQSNQLTSGYQINQALIAIGSGGITGRGYGQSTTKVSYLPEPIGDSIFAVIGEELGFVGSSLLVATFFLFVWRGLRIAQSARDNFGRFLATGLTCLVGLQAFVNIAAISGLIPLTGVPLPFVSYGGTALAVFLTMSGILLNISRYRT